MLIPLLTIALLIAAVGAIYLLLKSMGQDGVEVAAPGSCKRGKCGVRSGAASGTSCHQEDDPLATADEIKRQEALLLSEGAVVTPPAGNPRRA